MDCFDCEQLLYRPAATADPDDEAVRRRGSRAGATGITAQAGVDGADRRTGCRCRYTAIGQLHDKYRVPLVLAYYNDSSYEEIATDLSISRSHVGVLLLRAKQRLRSYLINNNGMESEA